MGQRGLRIEVVAHTQKIVIAALVAAIHRCTSVIYLDSSTLVEAWITATSAVMTNLAVLRLKFAPVGTSAVMTL